MIKCNEFKYSFVTLLMFVLLLAPEAVQAEKEPVTGYLGEAEDPFYLDPEGTNGTQVYGNTTPGNSFINSNELRFEVRTPGGDIDCSGVRTIPVDFDAGLATGVTDHYYEHPASYHLALADGAYMLTLNGITKHPTLVRHGLRLVTINSNPTEFIVEQYWAYNDPDNPDEFHDLISMAFRVNQYGYAVREEPVYPRLWEWAGNPDYQYNIHHSPKVQNLTPSPSKKDHTNNTGYITNTTFETFSLGDNINTWLEAQTIDRKSTRLNSSHT